MNNTDWLTKQYFIKLFQRTITYDDPDRQYIGYLADKVMEAIEQARAEEWAKIHTKYQPGTVKGNYKILEAVRRVGKNTKFRVECINCHAVMFRYANKFKLKHSNCAYELRQQLGIKEGE